MYGSENRVIVRSFNAFTSLLILIAFHLRWLLVRYAFVFVGFYCVLFLFYYFIHLLLSQWQVSRVTLRCEFFACSALPILRIVLSMCAVRLFTFFYLISMWSSVCELPFCSSVFCVVFVDGKECLLRLSISQRNKIMAYLFIDDVIETGVGVISQSTPVSSVQNAKTRHLKFSMFHFPRFQ